MKELILPVRREYFEQIKSGEKKFEYRLMSCHWYTRLHKAPFDRIVITLGYPKKGDESKRLYRKWNGFIKEKVLHEEFGPKSTLVFAIDVSEVWVSK